MLRALSRLAGVLLLAIAFAQVVVDGARSIAGGAILLTPFGALLDALAPGRFAGWSEAFSQSVPLLWEPVKNAPAAMGLTLVAGLLLVAGRVRRTVAIQTG